ncbi:hypothetical protein [Parahaliea aestuarii]
MKGLSLFTLGNVALLISLYAYCGYSDNAMFPLELESGLSDQQVSKCREASRNPGAATESIPLYWPPGKLDEPGDHFYNAWFSVQLCAMRELPLKRMIDGQVTIRLLIDSSFHEDIVIRIERDVAEVRMISRIWGAPELGTESRTLDTSEVRLSQRHWSALEVLLEELPFWELDPLDSGGGKDGSTWVLEVSSKDRYHIVERWEGYGLPEVTSLILALADVEPTR